jgi:hypothetical protein
VFWYAGGVAETLRITSLWIRSKNHKWGRHFTTHLFLSINFFEEETPDFMFGYYTTITMTPEYNELPINHATYIRFKTQYAWETKFGYRSGGPGSILGITRKKK